MDSTPPPNSGRKRRVRLLLAVIGAVVVLLLVAQVVVVNVLLSSRLEGLLNKRPEIMSVEWESAKSVVPGVVEVRGLVIRKQNRLVQWTARLDSGRARISLLGLMRRRLEVGSITGSGLDVRLRRRAPERPEGEAEAWLLARAAEPPIEDWTNPPDPLPEVLRPPDPDRKRWRFQFEDVDVRDVREIWIGGHRFHGSARLKAGLVDVQARHVFELDDAALEEVLGAVTVREEPIATAIAGRISCSIGQQDLEPGKAAEMLDDLDADVDLRGEVADLSLLDVHLRAIKGLSLKGGSGQVDAKVRIRDGSFASGTNVRADPRGIVVGVFAGRLTGDAAVSWEVKGDEGKGEVTFASYALAYADAGVPHVSGENLEASVTTRDLDLRSPFEDVEISVSVPSARVASIAAYSRWFPKGAPFVLTGGKGTIRGDVTLTPSSGHGRVHVQADDVRVRADDMDLTGSLEIDAPLVAARPQDGWFDFSGARVNLTDVSTQAERRSIDGWWGRIEAPELHLASEGGLRISGNARASLRDSSPIVATLATQRFVAKLFRGSLTDRNVEMTTRFDAGRGGWRVDDLEVHGDRIVAFACLDVHPPRKKGVVYFDGGMLSVGIRLDGDGRDVTPLARRAWWDRNRDACP